jgi:hypothetical protein
MIQFLPMFCLIMAGDSCSAVRHVASHFSKLVRQLPDGMIKDAFDFALADKENRPFIVAIIKLRKRAREFDARFKQMEIEMEQYKRKEGEKQLNRDFPNYEDYGPKPKRRVDG